MEKSYKQIANMIEDWVESHIQLQEFKFGKDGDVVTTTDLKYPLLYLSPQVSTFTGNYMLVNFDVLIIDLLQNELTNELDALSDTLQIFNDLLSKFWEGQADYGFKMLTDVDIEPVERAFGDFTIGHKATISCQVFNNLCYVETPTIENI